MPTQDILNRALSRPPTDQRPSWRAIHYDWRANYHPALHSSLNGWVIVHWQGARKPWGALPTFDQRTATSQTANRLLNPAMAAAWARERYSLRERCPLSP